MRLTPTLPPLWASSFQQFLSYNPAGVHYQIRTINNFTLPDEGSEISTATDCCDSISLLTAFKIKMKTLVLYLVNSEEKKCCSSFPAVYFGLNSTNGVLKEVNLVGPYFQPSEHMPSHHKRREWNEWPRAR